MKTIFVRELKSRLSSLTGWGAIACLLAAAGVSIYFKNIAGYSPMFADNVTYLALGMALCCGILCADAYPADRRAHAERAIFAAPVSSAAVFLGKFFASFSVSLIGSAILCVYALALNILAPAGGLAAGLCAVLTVGVLGAAFCALATAFSAMSRSGLAAFLCYAAVLALCYFMPALTDRLDDMTAMPPVVLVLLPALAGVIVWQLFDQVLAGFIAAAVVEIPVLLCHLQGRDSAVFAAIARGLRGIAVFDRLDAVKNGIFDAGMLIVFCLMACVLVFAGIAATMTRRSAKRRAL